MYRWITGRLNSIISCGSRLLTRIDILSSGCSRIGTGSGIIAIVLSDIIS